MTGLRNLAAGTLALSLVFSTGVSWGQSLSGIEQANQHYNKNQFEQAAQIYEGEIARERINGHLYFNLGNTYFRMGDLPRAILNFAKAQTYLPRDEDVEANLEYALRQTQDQLDGRLPSSLEAVLFWVGDFNLKEHLIALLGINLVFWVTLGTGLHQKTSISQSVRKLLLAILVLAILSTGVRWGKESRSLFGVVQPAQADVHSGWNETTAVLFQLHQGTLVSITETRENWCQLELPDGKKGWIQQANIVR